MLYAIGGGFIEVLVSPIVNSLQGDAKASSMSLLHSFYCWGQMGVVLVTTIFLKIIGTGSWFVLPVLWALIPLYNLFVFLKVPLMPTIAEEERTPLGKLFRSGTFLLALLLMMCAGSSELTMSQWSSLFAEKGLKVPKLIGDLLGPCLFALLMGIGRALYGVLGKKLPIKPALMVSSLLCVFCYAITVFIRNPFISLMGCAICGLSVSLMWPGTFSLTAEAYPKGGTAMFGLLAIFGDLGASIGPWLAGLISDIVRKSAFLASLGNTYGLDADQLGLKTGLLAAIVFPLALFIGLMLLRAGETERDAEQQTH
jgi:fucose permease